MPANVRSLVPAAFVLAGAVACAPSGDAGPGGVDSGAAAELAIRGVTVLSPDDGTRAASRTVLIEGDRVVGVGPEGEVEIPEGAVVVDGAGRFLMPGLWDFHTHLTLSDANAPALLVTQGVTGARDAGGILVEIDALRDSIRSGGKLGPRILRAGSTLNGVAVGPHHRAIESPAEAREAVADLKASGVDFLKTHNQTGRETYFALLEAAEDAGLDVIGHVPMEVSPLEACEAGHASVEHIATIFEGTYLAGFESEMEAFRSTARWLEEEAPALAECFAREGTLFVPTLVAYEIRAHRAALYDQPPPGFEYLSSEGRARVREENAPSEADRRPEIIELRESLVEVGQTLTRMMHDAGAPIGAGTDLATGMGVVPGFTLHREIELLVEAGLPESAAIRASARGPGESAGADPLTGRIEVGAPADLVLLRADPFEDIAALAGIEAVVLRGRLLDRAELDRVLSELAAR